MSRYSGKCDFKDTVDIFGLEDMLNGKIKVYIGDIGPLKFEEEKDLIPYYPYIVGFSCGNFMSLSQKSFVDMEEEDFKTWDMNFLNKEFKKAKRKKIEFTYPENSIYLYKEQCKKMFDILKEKNKPLILSDVDKIHYPMYTLYRKALWEKALKHGVENHPLIRKVRIQLNEYYDMFDDEKEK